MTVTIPTPRTIPRSPLARLISVGLALLILVPQTGGAVMEDRSALEGCATHDHGDTHPEHVSNSTTHTGGQVANDAADPECPHCPTATCETAQPCGGIGVNASERSVARWQPYGANHIAAVNALHDPGNSPSFRIPIPPPRNS